MRYLFNRFLAVFFRTTLGYFYRYRRSVHASGLEKIPKDKPILFCSNHPNAFMDALVIGSTVPRRTWFLVRSDVMRKPLAKRFLSFTSLIPIYRMQEGMENLSKNDETFERCAYELKHNQTIVIFSEGNCVPERRLRRLKKGTARIAFGTEERNDFKLGLTIVPVGVNYVWPGWKFRRGLHIRIGDPFEVREFEEIYRTDKPRAINQFSKKLEAAMAEQILVINDKANDELVGQLEEMFRRDWSKDKGRDPYNAKETFETSREIVQMVEQTAAENPEQFETFRDKMKRYHKLLHIHKLRDHLLKPESILRMGLWDVLEDFLIFSFGFPLWIFGVINNYLPYKIPTLLANKIVKNMEWHASINGTIGSLMFLFFYIAQILTVALVFRNWWLLAAYIVLLPISGHFAWWYWIRMVKSRGKGRLLKLMRKDRETVEELIGLRLELVQEAEAMRAKSL